MVLDFDDSSSRLDLGVLDQAKPSVHVLFLATLLHFDGGDFPELGEVVPNHLLGEAGLDPADKYNILRIHSF